MSSNRVTPMQGPGAVNWSDLLSGAMSITGSLIGGKTQAQIAQQNAAAAQAASNAAVAQAAAEAKAAEAAALIAQAQAQAAIATAPKKSSSSSTVAEWWSSRSTGEKVAIGVGAAVVVYAGYRYFKKRKKRK